MYQFYSLHSGCIQGIHLENDNFTDSWFHKSHLNLLIWWNKRFIKKPTMLRVIHIFHVNQVNRKVIFFLLLSLVHLKGPSSVTSFCCWKGLYLDCNSMVVYFSLFNLQVVLYISYKEDVLTIDCFVRQKFWDKEHKWPCKCVKGLPQKGWRD